MRTGTTWAITTYFDPLGCGKRREVYREFRQKLNIPLVAVELSYDGVFDLRAGDADILIQLRGGAILWQKERLLNIALKALPYECDAVAWLDCDVVFVRENWADAARRKLDEFALVQPFDRLYYLGRSEPPQLPEQAAESWMSFGKFYSQGPLPEGGVQNGAGRVFHFNPGMAWVARRETLDAHGFYDMGVVGGGDMLMTAAACGRHWDRAREMEMSAGQQRHYYAWGDRFHADVQGSISYTEGDILHLWHGELDDRRYHERHRGFQRFDFDPQQDLAQAPEGVWRWNSDKPELHDYVKSHFELVDRAWQRSRCCAAD